MFQVFHFNAFGECLDGRGRILTNLCKASEESYILFGGEGLERMLIDPMEKWLPLYYSFVRI